jgi:DNA-binding PadR family transcriptional regulator
MSLRHGLLGLLEEGPASGYDLTKRFEELLGSIWPAKHPQIYQELGRLADAGLIEIESHGPRQRKSYRIAPDGRKELARWLTEVPVDHGLKSEAFLRTFFIWTLPDKVRHRLLQQEAEFFRAQAASYASLAAAKDSGEFGELVGPTHSIRLIIEAGIRMYTALAEWAEWALEQYAATPTSTTAITSRPSAHQPRGGAP